MMNKFVVVVVVCLFVVFFHMINSFPNDEVTSLMKCFPDDEKFSIWQKVLLMMRSIRDNEKYSRQ